MRWLIPGADLQTTGGAFVCPGEHASGVSGIKQNSCVMFPERNLKWEC